jgi:Flp pilus assembly protein TadD
VFPAQAALALALLQAASPAHSDSTAIRKEIQQAIQAGHYEDARKELQQAIKRAPQDASLWSLLGEVNARLQDTGAAITALQKANSLAPKNPDVYFDLGLLFMQKGATDEALKVYRWGLALDPQNEPANQNYALLLMQQGKPCEAIGPLQRLKGTKSGDLAVRASLIESLWKCGNNAAGKKELAAFLEMPSATPEDRMRLAKVLGRSHLLDPAE